MSRIFSKALVSILSILVMVLTAGCSLDATIQSLDSLKKVVLQSKVSNREIIPASNQSVKTTDGYTVQSSVNFHSGVNKVITADGYVAETGVQSTLFKTE